MGFIKFSRVFRFLGLFLGLYIALNGVVIFFYAHTLMEETQLGELLLEQIPGSTMEDLVKYTQLTGIIILFIGGAMVLLGIICFIVFGVNKYKYYSDSYNSSKSSTRYVSSSSRNYSSSSSSYTSSSTNNNLTFKQVKDIISSDTSNNPAFACPLKNGDFAIASGAEGPVFRLTIHKNYSGMEYDLVVDSNGNRISKGPHIIILHDFNDGDNFCLLVAQGKPGVPDLIEGLTHTAADVIDYPNSPYKAHTGLVKYARNFQEGYMKLYNSIMNSNCMDTLKSLKKYGYCQIFEDRIMMIIKTTTQKEWDYFVKIFNILHDLRKQG